MFETILHTVSYDWLGLSVPGVAFGLVAMLLVLVLMFGTSAIADGGVSLVAATRPTTPGRGWLTAAGVGAIVLGIMTFVWPSITALGLVALIGAWLIVAGVEHVAAAIRMPRGTAGRGPLGVAGAVGVLFGIYLIAFPGRGALALVIAIGLYAVASGLTLIAALAASRRELYHAPAAVPQIAA